MYVQKVYLPSSFTKCIENCGLPDFVTDYQIRQLGNPFGIPYILLKIDPCSFLKQVSVSDVRLQKPNFGRKQQINVCPKLGFDVRNFGQFSIKKNCADIS